MPDMKPRTCIATREEKSTQDMIRFVLDGNLHVVPDLKRNLPGRGVWVSGSRSLVQKAVSKRLFAHGFKKPVQVSKTLAEEVEEMLLGSVLGMLSLARKAGLLVPGRANIEKALAGGTTRLVLHASDATGDGRRKLDSLVNRMKDRPMVFELCDSARIDPISGVANTMHLTISAGNMADRICELVRKLEVYRRS